MNENLWMSCPILEARTKDAVKLEPDQGGGLKMVLDKHAIGMSDTSDEEMAYITGVIERDMKDWVAKITPSLQSGAISPAEFKVLMLNHMKTLGDEYISGKRPIPPPPASMGAKAAPASPPPPAASPRAAAAGAIAQSIEAAKKFIMAQVSTKPVMSTIDLHRMMPAALKGPVYEKALFALADAGQVHVGKDADIMSFSDEERALLPKDGHEWVGYVMPVDNSSPTTAAPKVPVAQPKPAAPLAAPKPAMAPAAPAAQKPVRYEKAADVQAGLKQLGPEALGLSLSKTSWPNLASIAAELGCPTKDGNRNLKVEELVGVIMARLTGQPMPKLAPAAPVAKKAAPETPRKSQFSDSGEILGILQKQGPDALKLNLSKRSWQDLSDIFTKQFKGSVKGSKGNMKHGELVDAIVQAATKELNQGSSFARVIQRSGAERRAKQPVTLPHDPAALDRGRQIAAQVPQRPAQSGPILDDDDDDWGVQSSPAQATQSAQSLLDDDDSDWA